ncbi:unnamed protein product [Closterium sp. NIES-53]
MSSASPAMADAQAESGGGGGGDARRPGGEGGGTGHSEYSGAESGVWRGRGNGSGRGNGRGRGGKWNTWRRNGDGGGGEGEGERYEAWEGGERGEEGGGRGGEGGYGRGKRWGGGGGRGRGGGGRGGGGVLVGGVRMTAGEVERLYGTPSVIVKEVKSDGTTVMQVKVDGALAGLFSRNDSLRSIAQATSCVVNAPTHFNKRTHPHAVFEISGASEEAAAAGLDLFATVLAQAIESPAVGYSHFLSLPLASHRPLVARLHDFRSSVLHSVGFPYTHEHFTAPADAAAGSTAGVDAAAGDAATAGGGDNASGDADAGATKKEGKGEGVKDDRAVAVAFGVGFGAREGKEDCGEEAVEGEGRAYTSGGEEGAGGSVRRGGKRVRDGDDAAAAAADPVTAAVGAAVGDASAATTADGGSSVCAEGGEGGNGERPAVAGQGGETGEEKPWEHQPGGQRVKGVKDKYGGVHPSIFINPTTFHLTIQMLKLWSPLRVQAAADALQAAMPRAQEVLGDSPLVIRLVGLKYMKGHPSKAHVLYADMQEVDGGNRLPAVCEVLRAACREAGLVTPRDCRQPLKLHATIMNTSHRKGPHRNARVPFDASLIVAQHGDTEWGEVRLGEVHLSQRFKFDDQGYYHCCSSLPLP